MNRIFALLFLLSVSSSVLPARAYRKPSSLSITPVRAWHEFTNRHQASEQRILLCCSLMIRRSGPPLRVKKLTLSWRPDQTNRATPGHLTPSLYEAYHNKRFSPGTAVLSQGKWHAQSATIHFPLNYKLIGKHMFHIVVLANEEDAERLKHGEFVYADEYPLVTENVV